MFSIFFHIQWEKPTLIRRLYHVNLKLSLKCIPCSVIIVLFCPISILLHTKFNFVLCIIKTEDDRRTVETFFEKVSFIFLNFCNLRSHCLLWSFHLISGFDYFGFGFTQSVLKQGRCKPRLFRIHDWRVLETYLAKEIN